MNIKVREFNESDIQAANEIWNEVVEDGVAFPQEECLTEKSGLEFFKSQSYTGIAYDEETDDIVGLYILHPNNIGRCGHICNASYAVKSTQRGKHIGEILVTDCLKKAKEIGYGILQFNAVVATNQYKKLGFVQLGVIPKGFRMKDGTFEDIIPHYHTL
jgi:predicted N-acetyltransferase YhbS